MGGNQRHAAKGPDKHSSVCEDCEQEFTHGKFSHPDYCVSCRDDRQDPARVQTTVEAEHDTDSNRIVVQVRIENGNDVRVPDIPLERTEDSARVFGFVRAESKDGEAVAEDAWMKGGYYSTFAIRADQSFVGKFIWDEDGFGQDGSIGTKAHPDAGEEFRDFVHIERGNPFDASEIEFTFTPAKDSEWLSTASTTLNLHEYVVDLDD